MGVPDYKKLKVQELKDELAKRGLAVDGLKAVLIERLEAADKESENDKAAQGKSATAAPANQSSGHTTVTADQPASEAGQPETPALETPAAVAVPPQPAAAAPSAIDKKKQRAERFGVPVALSDEEKKKLRAERFGIQNASGANGSNGVAKGGLSEEDMAKKKARAERFGIPLAPAENGASKGAVDPDADEKKKKRAERFASEDEQKKKARAERFATAS